MADVLTAEQRRLNMSRIRGKDTKPEMVVRRGLHARGLRYRLQDRNLPGRPDLVFASHRVVVFVHGCFWHGHNCPMFRLPATRPEFWQAKIEANRARDHRANDSLNLLGWRALTIWECSLKGPARWPTDELLDACATFIRGTTHRLELTGRWK
ncbi:very short patch repair endonuclease [Delftia sp. ASV31]|uniref:very short patch repair endonuclease n=1 Tax=Delftia sp. ASV31 TaxID=2795113 RepID=UPI0018EE1E92|nr:very short patch repair endonuclease [Delftia sp. ASV31]